MVCRSFDFGFNGGVQVWIAVGLIATMAVIKD